MLCPWPPIPFDGGSKRVWSACRFLKDRFSFTLLCFRRPSPEDGPAASAAQMAQEERYLRPVFDHIYWAEPSDGRDAPAAAGVRLPEDAGRFYSRSMEKTLKELVQSGEFDLLHVEFDLMAAYARHVSGIPKVFTQHDVGTISFFGSYFREMAGFGKFKRIPEWLARRAFERQACAWFDRVIVLTEPDKERLSRICPRGKISAVSTGVDLEHFSPNGGPRLDLGEAIVYVGHYPHYPNEDAVVHFCRKILPRVRQERPGAVFHIVGSSPTSAVRDLGRLPGVRVVGTVEDIRPYLEAARVFVAPVRLGKGIKGKILEAFAMGVPVVASRCAANGLKAAPGRDLMVADDPAPFADHVIRMLESPDYAKSVGEKGRAAASLWYDWRMLARNLGGIYEELIASTSRKNG